jgi:hypothetical protein
MTVRSYINLVKKTSLSTHFRISAISSLPSNNIRKSFITGYRKDPFKSLIKEVEGKKGAFTRYTVENKLL